MTYRIQRAGGKAGDGGIAYGFRVSGGRAGSGDGY